MIQKTTTLRNTETHSFRSNCSIARTLEIVGDKWTLLIIRDLLWHEKHTFKELADADGMPTNLLSGRLRRLIEWDLVQREQYQDNPVRYRYRLTSAGRALEDTLLQIMTFGNQYLGGGKYTPKH